LVYILNEDCNFRCAYCYKKLSKARFDWPLARRLLVFFLPFLTKDFHLHFTGGEPLLSLALLRKIVARAEAEGRRLGKKAHFSLTTNGSLASPPVLRFLGLHRFTVTLSFDGTAQDIQRQPGTRRLVASRLVGLRDEAGIRLRVNSVFSPETVHCLSDSVEMLLDLGVSDFDVNLTVLRPWSRPALLKLERQMDKAVNRLLVHYRQTGRVALESFRAEGRPRMFVCAAGRDRLAFSPDGRIWGCHLFNDFFRGRERAAASRRYGLGTLADLPRKPGAVGGLLAPRFRPWAMDRMSTSRGGCFLCPEVGRCTVCPVNAALAGAPLGRIPLYACRIRKIMMKAEDEFHRRASGASRK
jgi:sulfatase maturation enzyme AslB (radical SAM superfamily)